MSLSELLPTPGRSGGGLARNKTANRSNPMSKHHDGTTLADVAFLNSWKDYAPAVARHAELVGRPPPPATVEGSLSPAFVEWMMGYPEGWITDVDIAKTGQLRCLGNAIVPLQAATAWAALLGVDVTTTERERERG